MRRSDFLRWSGAATLAAAWPPARARSGLVRLVVPAPGGAPTDVLGRLLAPALAHRLERRVVVENRPGAASLLAVRAVQHAPADGSLTAMVHNAAFVSLPFTHKAASYDPLGDFAPVAGLAQHNAFVFTHPSIPAHSFGELLRYARRVPEGIETATAGHGSVSHHGAAWLARRTGITLLPVPYRTEMQALRSLRAGFTRLMLAPASAPLMALVQAGQLRVLAAASEQRTALFPDVPLVSDSVPGLYLDGWYGLIAAPSTPQAAVQSLAAAARAALAEPGMAEQLGAHLLEQHYMGPRSFASQIAQAHDFFRMLASELDLRPL